MSHSFFIHDELPMSQMTFRQMSFVAVNYEQDEFCRQSVLIAELINLNLIDELIPSSKKSAQFIFHTNNAIFRPIPKAIVRLKTNKVSTKC